MKDKMMRALVDGKKSCRRCGEIKPLDAFHKNPSTGDGRHTRCKTCISIYMKNERRRTGKIGRPLLTADQLITQTCSRCALVAPTCEFPPNKWAKRGHSQYCRACLNDLRREQMKRRWRDPVAGYKHRVRIFTNFAIKLGTLIPLPCEVCRTTKVQAHHHDYSKPLEVRWLCRAHHNELHKEEKT